jgi:hypothetical protein
MVQHFQNLQLSVFISLILKDLLNGDSFSSLRNGGLEDNSKGSIANDLFCIIGEALLKEVRVE